MFMNPRRTKYPTEAQIEIWNLNRNKISGREIAKQKNVTPGFISKTLKLTISRIEDLMINASKTNKITLSYMNAELGFARGYNHLFQTTAYITFSLQNGLQIWYAHKGDCSSCDIFDECRSMLLQEFNDRQIKPKSPTLAPTDLSDELFSYLDELTKKEGEK